MNSHCEFSALPVDALACTRAKMANTPGRTFLRRVGIAGWLAQGRGARALLV
jgi:hypothetical protein